MLTVEIEKCSSEASTGRPRTVSEIALNILVQPTDNLCRITQGLLHPVRRGHRMHCHARRCHWSLARLRLPYIQRSQGRQRRHGQGASARWQTCKFDDPYMLHHRNSSLTDVHRLTLSAPSHATSKRRPQRSSSEVCPRKPPRQTSASSSHSSAMCSTAPS